MHWIGLALVALASATLKVSSSPCTTVPEMTYPPLSKSRTLEALINRVKEDLVLLVLLLLVEQ